MTFTFKKVILSLLIGIAMITLWRDTYYNGWDFNVFYHASVAWKNHLSPYSVGENGFVFKYPPWILPFFLPFSFFSERTAKGLWGVVQILSLISLFVDLKKQGIKQSTFFIQFIFFWFIFAFHALAGQIMLPLLALYYRAYSLKDRSLFQTTAFILLSSKIFLISALTVEKKNILNKKFFFLSIGIIALLTSVIYFSSHDNSIFSLIKSWIESAKSGGADLGTKIIYGRRNQGLPALFIRWLKPNNTQSFIDIGIFVFFWIIIGTFWEKKSKKFTKDIQMSGWLALATIIHPLAWVHSFVFVFPFCCFYFNQKKEQKNILPWIALICITLVSQSSLGTIGLTLEHLSIRSLGTLYLLFSFEMNGAPMATEKSPVLF